MRQRTLLLLLALLTLVSILGCVSHEPAESTETPSAPPTPTVGAPAEATPTTATEGPQSPNTAEPSDEAEPTESPAAPLLITFEPGETSTTLTGRLDEGDIRRYSFVAQEAGPVVLFVNAVKPVSLTIIQKDHLRVSKPAAQENRWRGELPTSGETRVDISSTEATPYTLTLSLSPSQDASIELAQPNGNEVWLEGTAQTILWRSSKVEVVDIEAASGGKAWFVAGQVDAVSGSYVWEIPVGLVSNFGVPKSDAMRVRVSSSRDPSLYDQNDRPFTIACPRIEFDHGATSATVTRTLEASGGRYRYALKALDDQAMTLEVSPASLEVTVWGAEDGSTWEIPPGSRNLSIPALPATQEYFITLTNLSDDLAVDYVVHATVR